MTEPSEDIELSTEDLKSVSGGVSYPGKSVLGIVIRGNDTMLKGSGPEGSGSGMTRRDYDKSVGIIDRGPNVRLDVGPISRER